MNDSHPATTGLSAQGLTFVLAAVIERNGAVLVCLRPGHKRHGGLWEFPGGKLEPGEGLLEAARRELREELGVEVVTVRPPLYEVKDPGSEFLIQFAPVEIVGEPQPLEHDKIRWTRPDWLFDLQMAPSDAKFRDGNWGPLGKGRT